MTPVWVRCPACHREWHEATICAGAWWSCSAEEIALRPFCKCGQAPPMALVSQPPAAQPRLFA